jgi:hypothetical protein
MKSMKSCIAELIDEEILSHLHQHETNEQFIERICRLCIDEIYNNKGFAPKGFGADVVDEIELEVVEVFRMKTYGYYNLQDYRQKQLKKRIG